MGTIYICNAFSLSMLCRDAQAENNRWGGDRSRTPRPISLDEARAFVTGENDLPDQARPVVSAVGHADTARIIGDLLGVPVHPNRVSVKLAERGDVAVIGQYAGPRLPEGATELPEGASIEWWAV